MPNRRGSWAAPGDVNAFFGLMLDNVAGLILLVTLLSATSGISTNFILQHMVPGTAVGVLVADLLFFAITLRLGRKLGRSDITSMPLGLDTPSTYGMILFVLGPAYQSMAAELSADGVLEAAEQARAERFAWHVGIASIFISGLFKSLFVLGSGPVRHLLPRAGLLGSLASIALVLIAFLPFLEVLHQPIIGLTALAIVLATLVGKVPLPGKIPGALGAVLVAGGLYYAMLGSDLYLGTHLLEVEKSQIDPAQALMPTGWLEAFRFEWVNDFGAAIKYLPIVLPLALATVVGGIDCTESAAAAGDEFHTGTVIGVEAFSTLIASLCGGVIQTTPYIGHPAYKAMGGRAAYTLATALFIGAVGLTGGFAYIYDLIPRPIVFPILIFIGLEITAQSFHATPKRHYGAVAIACVPALAVLGGLFAGKVLNDPALFTNGIDGSKLLARTQTELAITTMLSNGFILTSLFWASGLAMIIDRRWWIASIIFAICCVATLIGLMHSPLPSSSMFLPWDFGIETLSSLTLSDEASLRRVHEFAGGYLIITIMTALGALFGPKTNPELEQASTTH